MRLLLATFGAMGMAALYLALLVWVLRSKA